MFKEPRTPDSTVEKQPGSSPLTKIEYDDEMLSSAWCGFTLLLEVENESNEQETSASVKSGFHQRIGLSGFNKRPTHPNTSIHSFDDAVCRLEISQPCIGGAAPAVDDNHELARWSSELLSTANNQEKLRLETRVAAPLRFVDCANGERVMKFKLCQRSADKVRETKQSLASATLLLSELLETKKSIVVALASRTADCVGTLVAEVWRPRHDPKVWLRAVADKNAPIMDQAFRSSGQWSLEVALEPRGTHEIVRAALTPTAQAMQQAADAWKRRAEDVQAEATRFDDDAHAKRHGARRVRLCILGATHLKRRPRKQLPKADEPKSNGGESLQKKISASKMKALTKTTIMAAAGLAKQLRDGQAPRLGVDDGGDEAAPSAFAVAQFHSSSRQIAIGRTNTEYATRNPSFGGNARADAKCAHARPKLKYETDSESVVLKTAAECGDAAVMAQVFQFYVRRDEVGKQTSRIHITVYDERYSYTRGVEPVLLGNCEIPLPQAPSASKPAPIYYDLTGPNGEAAGSLWAWLHVASLDDDQVEAQRAFEQAQADRGPARDRDAKLLHTWLQVAGVPVDTTAASLAVADADHVNALLLDDAQSILAGDYSGIVVAADSQKQSEHFSPPLLQDSTWLLAHSAALARDSNRLSRFIECAASAVATRTSGFKSSMLKAEIEVAATPTNLHVQMLASEEGYLWTSATSGAPTAAGTLGAKRGGLLRLERELSDLAAMIKAKRHALAAASGKKARCDAAHELGLATRAWEARAASVGVRKTLARAHALAIAVAAVRAQASAVARKSRDTAKQIASVWHREGLPVIFQALVSTAGAELAMLEDAAAAVNALQGCVVCFDAEHNENDHHATHVEQIPSKPHAFQITIRLPASDVGKLGLSPDEKISLVPVLFSQGLDAKQSLANSRAAFESSFGSTTKSNHAKKDGSIDDDDAALSDNPDLSEDMSPSTTQVGKDAASGLQRVLNVAAFDTIDAYVQRAFPSARANSAFTRLRAAILKERAAEGKSFEKHWTILIEAESTARDLNAAVCIFCKSGKDRTAMLVTLAEALFLRDSLSSSVSLPPPPPPATPVEGTNSDDDTITSNDDEDDDEGPYAEAALLATANILREFGVRLRVAEKNTGRLKYAFNVIQRKFLPGPLRPPLAVIEDLSSSILYRDTS
uniref:Uncharacterized protein n=1 Tax=Aureoumbra lagunensis TaxID=44058 RepID=A0A7S3K1L9_9STRA|mmetsp:Transcript_15312/g.22995  ORF Transcript_15312/g.22995 Transcript_15312/m.22995 type:complete len:1165 (+) Transcript_15312:79-3573(+)|eukprot:CAMPEP_0197319082 /NCGR_PEP_ID=MMETSP0891-20130614/53382_1 /TAXON_ID=44058 ORGANISM="Aureoumbra lagunensis, Strain CCMP1510" /NCGR_SAMPLE_ID=MMETSP0891 /ASSEMBLY_ACC=CAM_ASM_000534 /LENGTH=1164 /DNA_ID=CAMNT_0042809839 /DNA_START=34 /DNA_END=3528 /DNA_ORIENTATION=+